MKLYLIPGLGADARVFQFLSLPIPTQVIQWLPPEPREPLAANARRLQAQIDPSQGVALLGVSFGGIVAQELAKIVLCQQLILLSSIQSERELPGPMRWLRVLPLHRLVPARWIKWLGQRVATYAFGAETHEQKVLLRTIIHETPDAFLRWAVEKMVHWRNPVPFPRVLHLHGTRDRLFPIRFIRKATAVTGGGHFMVVNRAKEVSQLINNAWATNPRNP